MSMNRRFDYSTWIESQGINRGSYRENTMANTGLSTFGELGYNFEIFSL